MLTPTIDTFGLAQSARDMRSAAEIQAKFRNDVDELIYKSLESARVAPGSSSPTTSRTSWKTPSVPPMTPTRFEAKSALPSEMLSPMNKSRKRSAATRGEENSHGKELHRHRLAVESA